MNYARHSHGICYLDNEVYVLGGVTKTEHSTGKCERFNVISKSWQSIPSSMYERVNPKLCPSFNSKVIYCFGGVIDDVDANRGVEILLTDPMEWRNLEVKLPIEFKGNKHHFCMMVEGKFYMPPLAI